MLRAVAGSNPGTPPIYSFVDESGTPGNATINAPRGRVAFAALASSVTVTNSFVSASSMIIATLRSTDGTLTALRTVLPGAGSFTITGNGATTSTGAVVDFLVVN